MQTRLTSNIAAQYHEAVEAVLRQISQTQMPAIERAAALVATTVQRDGIVYSLGSGHSLTVAAEGYYRAGGLANFDVIHDRTFGRAERLPGYAAVLLDAYPVTSSDLLIVISNSGRNPLPVEMALEGKARGIGTVAITSLAHSRQVTPRPPLKQRLFEVCDVVIDNCGAAGDASVPLPGNGAAHVCPTSTIAGIFIMNTVAGLAAEQLVELGIDPPVFRSANIDGADERNAQLYAFLRERVKGL